MSNLVKYGFFSFPAAISLLTMQVYMPTYLSQFDFISFSAVGVIFFLARLVDTVSDPVIGYYSDHTEFIFGRRRTWLFSATPIFLIVFYLFISPPENQYLLFLITVCWYVAGTCLLVPYYAWGAEIEKGYDAHNRFTGARVIFGLVGTVFALILPFIIFGEPEASDSIILNINLVAVTMIIALILMLKLPDSGMAKFEKHTFAATFNIIRNDSYYLRLLVSQFFNATANAVPATLFILFTTHVLERSDLTGILLISYFLLAAASVPVWVRLSKKWQKERCWRAAMVCASVVFAFSFFVTEGELSLFIAITVITGFMAGADLCLPGSMLADVAEINHKKTGINNSGIYFAFWGTLSKLSLALAVGITFPLLDLLSGIEIRGELDPFWLTIMYGLFPAVFKMISIAFFWQYKLADEDLKIIKYHPTL